jgi:hypothetical protein
MIRMDLIVIALSVTLISCNGRTAKQNAGAEGGDTVAKPQTSVKVDKQYDSSGNLVKYDSTYSYYYSKINDNKNLGDSIYHNFRDHFIRKYSFSSDPFFNDLFFQDSLLQYDFYRKDFFMNRFRNNMMMMDSLFWGMDSLKNSFFNKQFKIPGPLRVP